MYIEPPWPYIDSFLFGSGPKGRGFESRHFDTKPSESKGSGGFCYVPLQTVTDFYNVQYNVPYNVPTMYKVTEGR